MKKRVFDNEAKMRIADLVRGVLTILPFNAYERVNLRFEYIGEGTFVDTKIGAVNSAPYNLTINIDWYETAEEEDVRFLIRHEARHLYQRNQVEMLREGKPLVENRNTVLQWARNLSPGNYISNTPETEIQYFRQPCEFDAYCFATFISNAERVTAKGCNIQYTDYPGIGDVMAQQVVKMIQATPYENLLKYREFFSKQRA
ncbi:MAG: hypothetical protein E7238_02430 [Sarcina sp.]|nr:hypothetical protein [Sarcina sp.]